MVKRIKIKKSEAAARLTGGYTPRDAGTSTVQPSRSPLNSLAPTTNTELPTVAPNKACGPSTAKSKSSSVPRSHKTKSSESSVDVLEVPKRPMANEVVLQNPITKRAPDLLTLSDGNDQEAPLQNGTNELKELSSDIGRDAAENDSTEKSTTTAQSIEDKESSLVQFPSLTSVPLLSHRTKSCWVCYAQLDFPADDVAYYMKYAHPIIPAEVDETPSNTAEGEETTTTNVAIFVCSECAPALAENDKECLETDGNAALDTCSLCLEDDHEGPLFLCDGCPRQVCQMCVACCNGGGEKGIQYAIEVAESKSQWMCPVCEPPKCLKEIADKQSQPAQRTLEDLLTILFEVEQMKDEAESMLDNKKEKKTLDEDRDPDSDKRKNAEDMLDNSRDLDSDDEWKDDLDAHERRLLDTISHLQDELETSHNVDLAQLYFQIFKKDKPSVPDKVEAWVEEANREIQQRYDMKAKNEWGRLRDEFTDVVEDLENGEYENLIKPKAKGWSSTEPSAHPEDIADAMAYEDAMFERKQIRLVRVAEETDEIVTKQSSSKAFSRPFRDDFATPQQRRRKKANRVPHPNSVLSSIQDDKKSDSHENSIVGEATADSDSSSRQTKLKPPTTSNIIEAKPRSVCLSLSGEKLEKALSLGVKKATGSSIADNEECISIDISVESESDPVASDSRTIQELTLANGLKENLKEHQLEGFFFLGRNCFGDCLQEGPGKIAGALLAHNMGLGKTLTSIALVHTVSANNLGRPISKGKPRILICVPLNTLENWRLEFEKWDRKLGLRMDPPLCLNDANAARAKEKMAERWIIRGGVMLCTHRQVGVSGLEKADLVINDEAHVALKNQNTISYKNLSQIKTKRRIALSGTPIQNNLREYYSMIQWIQPGVLPDKAPQFERDFIDPINAGLVSDCTPAEHQLSVEKTKKLQTILDPYVQRKSASLLAKTLPPLQQSVLYVQKSKLQSKLYTSLKRFQKKQEKNSFFITFSALRHINNAPGTLPLSLHSRKEDDKDDAAPVVKWWEDLMKKYGSNELSRIEHSNKLILLLHILVKATKMGDKTVVFSQSLSTLDFVEAILQKDWSQLCPSISELIRESGFGTGRWKKNRDYLRIDGSVTADERGDRINEFEKDGSAFKLFLLSTVAGGIGINLVAANRVVLLDTHFNPSLSEQAIFRTYRYGQTKPVFVYRLLIENGIEEKIYARTVTKTGLAIRVIDKKTVAKHFSNREIADLSNNLDWIQCDKCEKWRCLLHDDSALDDDDNPWFCSMNPDPHNNKCSDPERSQAWYESAQLNMQLGDSDISAVDAGAPTISKEEQQRLEANDPILQHLLVLTQGQTKRKIVSKSKFHNFLVATKGEHEASESGVLYEPNQTAHSSPKKRTNREKEGGSPSSKSNIQVDSPSRRSISKSKGDHSPNTVHRNKSPNSTPGKRKKASTPSRGGSKVAEVIQIDDIDNDKDRDKQEETEGRGKESITSASSSRYSRRRRKATDRYSSENNDDKQKVSGNTKKRQKVAGSKVPPTTVKGRIIDLCDSD